MYGRTSGSLVLFAGLVLAGCKDASSGPATATATTETAAAKSASAPAPSASVSFPELDDTCSNDGDCTVSTMLGTCCGGCEQRVCSKAFVARVNAYCAAHPAPMCPPLGCAMPMLTPVCVAGKCKAK